METLTVGAAAARTGWSARMLRYLEAARAGRAPADAFGLSHVRARRAEPAPVARELCAIASRSSWSSLRSRRACAGSPSFGRRSTAGWPAPTPAPGSTGSSASTSGCSPPERRASTRTRPHWPATEGDHAMATTKNHDVKDASLAPEGRAADRVGRPADAGAGRDQGAVRARAAAGRLSRRRLSARDERDGEPDAHAEGRRGRRRALRVEPALDAGRRRRGARPRVRHRVLRHQGRGQRHVLLAHRGGGRPQAAADDGRRRRRDRRAPQRPPRPARRHHRRHGGDDHRASSA